MVPDKKTWFLEQGQDQVLVVILEDRRTVTPLPWWHSALKEGPNKGQLHSFFLTDVLLGWHLERISNLSFVSKLLVRVTHLLNHLTRNTLLESIESACWPHHLTQKTSLLVHKSCDILESDGQLLSECHPSDAGPLCSL